MHRRVGGDGAVKIHFKRRVAVYDSHCMSMLMPHPMRCAGKGQTKDTEVTMSNLTLINFFLHAFGPMREDHLCASLLAFQVMLSVYRRFTRDGQWAVNFTTDQRTLYDSFV